MGKCFELKFCCFDLWVVDLVSFGFRGCLSVGFVVCMLFVLLVCWEGLGFV